MSNNKKDSNPKDALGVKKVPLHAVPVKPLLEVGLAMMEGGRKYGTHNYRAIGVRMSTYYDAVMRHMMAWWEGEDVDPDSGIHHLIKTMASLFVIRDSMHMRNCIDDRPIQYPNGFNIGGFNGIAADLITRYPECAKPFTQYEAYLKEKIIEAESIADIVAVGAITGRMTSDKPNIVEIEAESIVDAAVIEESIAESVDKDKLRFEVGDEVRIVLRDDAGKTTKDVCAAAFYKGIYVEAVCDGYMVKLDKDTRWFYDDEIFPVEDG